jgi:hypothetical protein
MVDMYSRDVNVVDESLELTALEDEPALDEPVALKDEHPGNAHTPAHITHATPAAKIF